MAHPFRMSPQPYSFDKYKNKGSHLKKDLTWNIFPPIAPDASSVDMK